MRFFSRMLASSHSGVSSLAEITLADITSATRSPVRFGVIQGQRARRRQGLDPPRPPPQRAVLLAMQQISFAQHAEDMVFGVDDRQGADIMIDEQAYGRRDIVVRSDRHNLADHHIARIHNSFSSLRPVGPTGMYEYQRQSRFFGATIARRCDADISSPAAPAPDLPRMIRQGRRCDFGDFGFVGANARRRGAR